MSDVFSFFFFRLCFSFFVFVLIGFVLLFCLTVNGESFYGVYNVTVHFCFGVVTKILLCAYTSEKKFHSGKNAYFFKHLSPYSAQKKKIENTVWSTVVFFCISSRYFSVFNILVSAVCESIAYLVSK